MSDSGLTLTTTAHRKGATVAAFTFVYSVVVLWLALIVLAVSAFATLTRTNRRDRHGFVDPSALGAIGTILSGPIVAALIVFMPRLMAISAGIEGTPHAGGPIAEQIGETWVWVATVVVLFWFYALASAIFITGVYYLQQRRLRAADPST